MVLTPANAHLPIAEAAFAAGKHVLCEKPLEVSIERGEQLIAAGRRADRRLGICLQHRFRPGSQRLHEVLRDRRRSATIQAATMMVPWWRPQSYYDEPGRGVKARDGGGVLITQAIHTLDLFRWLVGIETHRGGAGAHHGAAPDGDRGLRIRAGAPRQRRARHDHRHRRGLARQSRMDPHHRLQGHRAAGRRQPANRVPRWAGGGAGGHVGFRQRRQRDELLARGAPGGAERLPRRDRAGTRPGGSRRGGAGDPARDRMQSWRMGGR